MWFDLPGGLTVGELTVEMFQKRRLIVFSEGTDDMLVVITQSL